MAKFAEMRTVRKRIGGASVTGRVRRAPLG